MRRLTAALIKSVVVQSETSRSPQSSLPGSTSDAMPAWAFPGGLILTGQDR